MSLENAAKWAIMNASSAQFSLDGYWSMFHAAMVNGNQSRRQRARDAVMSATEALMDAYEIRAIHSLREGGLDPDDREKQ